MSNIDDIIGLFILILVGLAGIIGKIRQDREEKRKGELKPEGERRASELPESTRRQIYGPGEVRKARPLVVQPSLEDDEDEKGWTPVSSMPPPIRPEGRPRPMINPEVVNEIELEERRKRAEWEARQREEQARRRAIEEMRRRLEAERQERRPPPKPQRPTAAQRTQVQSEPVEGEERRHRPVPKAPPRLKPEPQRARAWSRRALFKDTNDLKRAVILREILGPPRGLE